jgi:branched-chain amino acid:cation transporter, LIVCS family
MFSNLRIGSLFKSPSLPIGLAMFSMFFGAGNVIFPLAVGQFAGDKNIYAILGLILTAALMPIIGVIAMILFEGNYRHFFGRVGKIAGFLLPLVIITLLGPLGSTPRCIALSYTTLKSAFFPISPILFSALACLVIFLCTIKKNHIITLLGWVLTPLLLLSLLTIIVMGLLTPHEAQPSDQTNFTLFWHGLKEGYNTMDLLASFFFSSTILNMLRLRSQGSAGEIKTAFKASILGAILLASVYIGFSYLAAFHGGDLTGIGKDELLAAITMKIAGPHAGLLVCTTIALACLTTAIALISAFTDFMQREVFKSRVSYEIILIGALLATFVVSIFEFNTISAFLGPILQICYPGLIVLTLLNIAYRLKNFKPVKFPVFFAFALFAIFYFTQN